jgi:glucose-1-phosphate thymidylyltransferase
MNDSEKDDWIGLVPAAGKGLRLGLPYPKELYPIIRDNRYKPVAQFVIDNLLAAQVRHIVLVINESKGQLIGYFGSGSRFGCQFSYVVQEPPDTALHSTSPGLVHALDAAYHLIRGKTVFFGMADTIMRPVGIFSTARSLLQPDDDLAMVLFPTKHPEKFGMVKFEKGQVLEIIDKPEQTDLNYMWGCMIWKPRFSEFLHESVSSSGTADFATVLNDALRTGIKMRAVSFDEGEYIDLGTYEEIMELDKRLRD